MKPLLLIECIRITYDAAYADDMAGKMVSAAYPSAQGAQRESIMAIIRASFQMHLHLDAITEWSLEETIDFVDLYQAIFIHADNSRIRFVQTDDLLKRVSNHMQAMSPGTVPNVPFWFRTMYFIPKQK